MFKSAHDLAQAASLDWVMGVFVSLITIIPACGLFWMGCRKESH